MNKRAPILAIFILSIACIPITAQQKEEQPTSAKQSQRPTPRPGESKGDPPSSQTESKQHESATDQRGTDNTPIVVKTLPVSKTQEQATQEQHDREDEAANKRGMLWLSGFTLFVLIVQSYVLYNQNQIMKSQSLIMKGQQTGIDTQAAHMLAGLALTKQAADAAQNSAVAAEGALTLGQSAERAWLLFQGATLLRPLVVGQPILAQYVFKNTGHTPALGIRAGANFYIWEGVGEPDPTIYFDPAFPRRDIGAGEPWIGQANRTSEIDHRIVLLSDEEWQDLQRWPNAQPRRVLFLIGAVEYVDVFQLPITKDTVPNYSNFCAQFLIDTTGGGVFVPAKCHIQIR